MIPRSDWRSPLNIPAAKSGGYEIVHETIPAGHDVLLRNMRNLIIGGQKGPSHVVFNKPTTWHYLKSEDHGTWMSDLPIEQRQHDEELRDVKAGTVLVGGLGLGYAATLLASRPRIKKVVVVEISPDVVSLVGPHTAPKAQQKGKLEIVTADLFDYLRGYGGEPFDRAFYDIWQSDGEHTFHKTVVPLRKLSAGKVHGHPVCWNENVMRGQLAWGLRNRLLWMRPEAAEILPPRPEHLPDPWEPWPDPKDPSAVWHDWAVPFWKWYKEDNPSQDQVDRAVGTYAGIYGMNGWEEDWEYFVSRLT